MKYKCVIIDDEDHGIDILKDLIDQMPQLQLIRSYTDPLVALAEILAGENLDFIFSDMEMPGLNGLELGELVRHKTRHFIFATAHGSFALDAYNIHTSAYLLKPISFKQFETKINPLIGKGASYVPQNIPQAQKPALRAILVKDMNKSSIPILLEDILYAEIKGDTLSITTRDEVIETNKTLKEIEELLLEGDEFLKIQRAFIIGVKFIKIFNDRTVTMKDNKVIPIGKTFKSSFSSNLGKLFKR
jgi:DNA-binding LytR/AlgR family response regulator